MSEKSFELRLTGIELVSKSLELPKGEVKNEEINFNFSVDIQVSQERKLAIVVTDVSIMRLSNEEKLGSFKTAIIFEFPHFDDVFNKVEETRFDVPLELEILLKSTGLSTMRGIIYSELRGTHLSGAVMPIIDIASIISQKRNKPEENKKKKKK